MLYHSALMDRRKARTQAIRTVVAVLFAALLSGGGVAQSAWAQHSPYVAYVNADEVYVRSGPGKNYYPTQKIQRGEAVEVYRHDPGGWYAIRPPEGSFSWVSGEFIRQQENDRAAVIGDRVVARVGSEFSDVRDVIQVRLHRGEQVQVLDTKEFNPGPAAQTWYKIAPPSGEFRWIHGSFVTEHLVEPEPPVTGPRRNLLVPHDDDDEHVSLQEPRRLRDDDVAYAEHREPEGAMPVPRGNLDRIADHRGRTGSGTGGRITSDLVTSDVDDTEISTPNRALPEPSERGDLDHERQSLRVASRQAARTNQPLLSREEQLALELDQLDLELSTMVSLEPSAWHFDDLFGRANTALDRGETALERGRARLLLNKVEKFADIRRRMDAFNEITSDTDRANRPFTAGRATSIASSDRYDGVGRLARVQTARPGVPGYALTDSAGAIRYFVTPAPGVNLRHYLGQEVGISGQVGYSTELEQQHVTAHRVTVLGERTARR